MKNFGIGLVVGFLVFGSWGTALAQPNTGAWESPADFAAGSWEEELAGGGEGQQGNLIRAGSAAYQFGDATLQQVVLLSEPVLEEGEGQKLYYEYQTLYNGGLLELYNIEGLPWYNAEDGASFAATLGVVKVITQKFVNSTGSPTNEMAFRLTAVAEFGRYPGYRAVITAEFAPAVPGFELGDAEGADRIYGELSSAQITIEGSGDLGPAIGVSVDIKPGSCPNPFNVKSRGVLPVAILGSADLDVSAIDPDSVLLILPGAEEPVPIEALRWSLEDVSAPKGEGDLCVEAGPDGYPDLTLKFDTQEIVAALGEVQHNQEVAFPFTALLWDGTEIAGEDAVLIKAKSGKAKGKQK